MRFNLGEGWLQWGSEPALNLGAFLEQLPPGESPAVIGRRGIAGVPQCPCVLSPSTRLPLSGLLGPACWSLTGTGDPGLGGSRGERQRQMVRSPETRCCLTPVSLLVFGSG